MTQEPNGKTGKEKFGEPPGHALVGTDPAPGLPDGFHLMTGRQAAGPEPRADAVRMIIAAAMNQHTGGHGR